jgi:dynein intermediate chain 1
MLHTLQAETSTTDSGTGGESGDAAKRLRNQFNFSERGAQTTYFPPRERETSTDTPETAEAVGACSQWEIFDAYVADQKLQRQQARILCGPAK